MGLLNDAKFFDVLMRNYISQVKFEDVPPMVKTQKYIYLLVKRLYLIFDIFRLELLQFNTVLRFAL